MVMTGVTAWKRLASILVSEGKGKSLIVVTADGWQILAFLRHNMTAEQIEAERRRKAENVAAFRARMAAEKEAMLPVTLPVTSSVTVPVTPTFRWHHRRTHERFRAWWRRMRPSTSSIPTVHASHSSGQISPGQTPMSSAMRSAWSRVSPFFRHRLICATYVLKVAAPVFCEWHPAARSSGA
jgi:hypothetical protein